MLGPILGAPFTLLFAWPIPTPHPGLSRDITSQKPSLNPGPLAFPLHMEQSNFSLMSDNEIFPSATFCPVSR